MGIVRESGKSATLVTMVTMTSWSISTQSGTNQDSYFSVSQFPTWEIGRFHMILSARTIFSSWQQKKGTYLFVLVTFQSLLGTALGLACPHSLCTKLSDCCLAMASWALAICLLVFINNISCCTCHPNPSEALGILRLQRGQGCAVLPTQPWWAYGILPQRRFWISIWQEPSGPAMQLWWPAVCSWTRS